MYEGASLDWWETPLSVEGYKWFSVTEGSWQSNTFIVPIDCRRASDSGWERWVCSISKAIWVRVIADDLYDVMSMPKFPDGPFRGPFFRIVGSKQKPIYEDWLKTTGVLKAGYTMQEFLIGSMENEIHFLSMEEPSFTRLAS